MIRVETVSVVLASADVLVAMGYHVFQLRYQIMFRQTDLIMRLYDTWDGREIEKDSGIFTALMKFKDYDEYLKSAGARLYAATRRYTHTRARSKLKM